jgi:diacylglycerol O-acyltransferase
MDRLSMLDAEFLHFEDGFVHLHIAGVCVFEGPAPSIDEVTALVAGKLHLIPRYRQVVEAVPLELGRPVWVDDQHFNLSYHLRQTALSAPGDDAALRSLMGRLMSQPLDRHRPLRELWIVEGLGEDKWALIAKIHHCMVDGVSGVDLLTILLDLQREVELLEPQPWTPAPEPSGPAKVLDAWGGLASDIRRMARGVPDAVRHPRESLGTAWRDLAGMVTFSRALLTTSTNSLEGPVGPHRVWAHAESSLGDVKAVGRVFGGTVNDVVLAAAAAGYRALLQHRHEDVDTEVVRTLVPVSVRGEDAHGIPDNRVSGMLYELPISIVDPLERLAAVRADMRALKGSHMAESGEMLIDIGDLAPPMVVGTATRMAIRALHKLPQRSVNTVTTNVPGPQFPLYCLGREMLAYYPFVPIAHGARVGTAILSYNGTLSFGVTGDFDSAPDVDVLARAIAAGVDELHALAVSSEPSTAGT